MFKFSIKWLLACVLALPVLSFADHSHRFRLEHFAGAYAANGQSSGGSLFANSVVTQYEYDREGNGIVNFLSASFFGLSTGFITEVRSTNTGTLPIITRKLNLLDGVHGTGFIVTQNFPVAGAVHTTDFVALKRRNGIVTEIYENVTGNSLGDENFLNGTGLILSKRQTE